MTIPFHSIQNSNPYIEICSLADAGGEAGHTRLLCYSRLISDSWNIYLDILDRFFSLMFVLKYHGKFNL